MKVILLFLDGVGLGEENPEINPFFRSNLPHLRRLLGGELPSKNRGYYSNDGIRIVPVDVKLGVEGLPQSGTGQVALFTGVNAPERHGGHFGPYPPTTLRDVLEEKNILRQLLLKNKTVVFANAFPRQFFEYTRTGTLRLTVTTLACMFSGIPLLTSEHLSNDEGISADLIRERWPELGYPEIKKISAREAGNHLVTIAERHDFTLFEYWLPDHAGHKQDFAFAIEVLERLDGFLGGIIERIDFSTHLLVLISDHGNIEDLSTKSHTLNDVPCIVVGKKSQEFVEKIRRLTDLTPTIINFLITENG